MAVCVHDPGFKFWLVLDYGINHDGNKIKISHYL